MQVQTTEGIILTLTPEQIIEIDRQVKAKQVTIISIEEKVKSWDDAFRINLPKYTLIYQGNIHEENNPRMYNSHTNVSSEKRAKSVLAYCKLSVIFDALNEGWEPNWSDHDQNKFRIYYQSKEKRLDITWDLYSKQGLLYLKSEKLVRYVIEQFPELLKDLFMID